MAAGGTASERGRTGRLGEEIAVQRLTALGYRVVERNFRTREGEVDIVAWDGDELVFVEVKARRDRSYGLPEESITRAKAEHLVLAAQSYLERMEEESPRAPGAPAIDWRIDVVAIEFGPGGGVRRFEVLKGAVGG